MNNGRLSIGVVGAGPVGSILGTALAAAGHNLVGFATTDQQNIERLDALLPGVLVKQIPELIAEADLVLLAVPADQLEPLTTGIAEAGLWRAGQLVAHTAGQFGYGVLSAAAKAGAIPLAIHPAMSFTGTSIDLVKIRESYFAVAAPNIALPIAQALVIEIGAEPVEVPEADRANYFEAVSVATSFSRLVVNQAIGLLENLGLENPRGLIGPLIRSSVEQALADGHQPIDPEELLA